jgi:cytoskeletal protein RodZ
MTNFGASFKKAREAKGISLDQIAKQTRISTRFLTAIENEEFHVLPGGIFNRGFVRSFAEALGLDAEEAVADYERLLSAREPIEDVASEKPPPVNGRRQLYPVAIVILAVAIAAFYIVTRESGRTGVKPASSPPAPAAQPAPPAPHLEPEVTEAAAASLAEPEAAHPAAAQSLTLDIEAREKTWIRVVSDGNSVNPGEVLEPGMTRQFTAENSIKISIGNAAGLTLKVNDRLLKPLGKSGEVRSLTITPANLKDFIG